MNISDKLCVPSLQSACLQFLLSHAAGKPIKAMRIAEIFGHEELYRESSRWVLARLAYSYIDDLPVGCLALYSRILTAGLMRR
jgi:hypothetical protein